MSATEKLLAEIEEACAKLNAPDDPTHPDWVCRLEKSHLIANARTWLPKLVEIVREQQKEIECEYTLKQAARLEAVIVLAERYQAELEEMRGDLAEMLYEIGPCERDDGRTYCYTHVSTNCSQIATWRAKYLEVKP